MTATERLRAMLDERGVEHWDTVGRTEYRGEYGRIVRCYSRLEPITLDVAIVAAPPEQAIEATLGSDLEAENAKLRELVRDMWTCIQTADKSDNAWDECDRCILWNGNNNHRCKFDVRMHELGVEV